MAAETAREQSPAPNALKRRQSDTAEEEEGSKRQRTTPGKDSPQSTAVGQALEDQHHQSKSEESKNDSPQDTTKPATDRRGSDSRRKSSVVDEKQRSKRLFGGLLGNLAQPGNTVSKRRQEIEARRKAELQRQDDERLEDKQKRVEQSAARRKQVKRRLDEQAMRVRHTEELRNAHFLQTKAEPKLYYTPWELRPSEEDTIDEQIRQTESRVERERAELESSRPVDQSPVAERTTRPSPDVTRPESANVSDGQDHHMKEAPGEYSTSAEQVPGTRNPDDTHQAEMDGNEKVTEQPGAAMSEPATKEDVGAESQERETGNPGIAPNTEKDAAEHDEDHVVEGEEDTVIY